MGLVLPAGSDPSAAWAAEGLRERGLAPIELAALHELDGATWNHRVGSHGARIEIALRDGRRIVSGRVRGVLNRIVQAPPETIRGAARADHDYALSELTAFYMSWRRSGGAICRRCRCFRTAPTKATTCSCPWMR